MSHYRVLGVPPGATRVQVRAAYLRAARAAHPDLQPRADGPSRQLAADRMCAVNEAWRVLGDPARRRIYDAHRIATAAGTRSRPRRDPAPTGGEPEPRPGRVPGQAPPGGRSNPIVLVPAGLFALSVLQLVFGLLIGVPAVLATSAATFALSLVAFAAAPLLMLAANRNDRRTLVG